MMRTRENRSAEGELVLGVDLGGTKVETSVVDAHGRILASVRHPTEAEQTADEIIADIVASVGEVSRKLPGAEAGGAMRAFRGVGVGVAGQVDAATGSVTYAPNLRWRDVALQARLEAALALPVAVLNDVQSATFGEWSHGAGRGVDEMVCVFVGTGVGGGVVAGGRLVRGCTGSAGELGHTIVDLEGPPCHCGSHGCLEAHAGGWAIAQRAQEAVSAQPDRARALLAAVGGRAAAITARVVTETARAGDPLAQDLMAGVMRALAAGAASIVNAFNPCVLVLGGGVLEGAPELLEAVRAGIARRALPAPARAVQVVPAALGPHAGSVGAAAWLRASRPAAG